MQILVLTKTSIPSISQTIPQWPKDVYINESITPPDVIISMGVGVMEETFDAIARYPKAKLFCYNWDCYAWVWTSPRPGEYDYNRYGSLLRKATEVWVPSACTAVRTKQWWDLDSKIILSSIPVWDYDTPMDLGYVLCTLRQIPDPQWDWFEKACEELCLPYKMPNHEVSYEEYKTLVANCHFMVSHLYEASTGGLSLLEGYCHGKPSLICGSPYNGARDYFRDRATYFESYQDMLSKMLQMYYYPKGTPWDAAYYVKNHFSDTVMVSQMKERIRANTR